MDKDRNYGIDCLRIVSMFFVVILHCLGHGGVLYHTIENSNQYKLAWLIEIIAFKAVDMFALISGYVSYTGRVKKVNYKRYIVFWFQVVFYGLISCILIQLKNPERIKLRDWVMTITPVTNGVYWYFSAYTGLFVIMPLLNNAILNCEKEKLRKLFVLMIIVFSFLDAVAQKFNLNQGYSFIWISLLYLLGGIIKKCDIGKKQKKSLLICIIIVLDIIAYLYKIYGIEVSIMNIRITKNLLVDYVSPTILINAILMMIIFSKIKFGNFSKKIIEFVTPATFGIYLLNDNYLVRENFVKDRFLDLANGEIVKILLNVLVFAILFCILAILVDKIRGILFEKCHIEEFAGKVTKIGEKIIAKISKII